MLLNSYLPHEDGITHINIYTRGSTQIGRFLTNLSGYRIYSSTFDKSFPTVEHLWFWLKTNDDRILEVGNPFNIKPFIKNNKIIILNNIPDFKKIIIKSFVQKLKNLSNNDKELFNLFYESTLPFTHYYFYGEKENAKVIEQPQHEWQVKAWERIRHEIKKPGATFTQLFLIADEIGD